MSKVLVVAGMLYGDEGKGSIVDFLCRLYSASLVARYNGGPQANHNVLLDDGRHHGFSQLGSGSFNAGVRTHLSRQMLISPGCLLEEIDKFMAKGGIGPLERLSIDPRTMIVTPWHRILGRLRELSRGNSRHGSVGRGVGEAVRERQTQGKEALRIGDLADFSTLHCKLRSHWTLMRQEIETLLATSGETALRQEFENNYVSFEAVETAFAEYGQILCSRLRNDADVLEEAFGAHQTVVLEGAQGMLLDRERGFYPHVTKTDISYRAAEKFLGQVPAPASEAVKIAVLRAYATRHGAGPFVTEDVELTQEIREAHNKLSPWQGPFRVGHFDLLATRYALATSGGADQLAITSLDRLYGGEVLICTEYRYTGPPCNDLADYFVCRQERQEPIISDIKHDSQATVERQTRLSELLFWCKPHRFISFGNWGDCSSARNKSELSYDAAAFLSYLESSSGLGVPIGYVSVGPTESAKFAL